jgi:type VI secretion system secreted protein VgrG
MKDLFTLKSKALPAGTRVAGFQGTEALSSVYRISVFLHIAHDEEFDMTDALGARARLDILPGEYALHGILADVELLNDYAKSGLFRATLVPELWQLSLTRHSRVFVGESVPQIITKVLLASGLLAADFKIDVQASYKPLDHVSQYQESNLDFISRWMEREGMYYYFEQGDDREILIITDYLENHHALSPKPVRYHAQSGGDVSAGASVESFTCKQARLPTAVHLKEYDYTKPTFDVSGSQSISAASQGEIHSHAENFLTPDEGKRLATVRAQEFLAREKVFQADGRVYNLRSGYTFLLEDHPRAAFNADYLVTSLEHFGNQSGNAADLRKFLDLPFDDVYRCHVICIPAKTQYRAPRVTPIPRIYGVEEAVIDAEDGHPYAEIDSHGRYKVKIKFDESDLDSGKASMWVRMLQPHGGDIEGFHFPLRKGTEVLLVFMGGDPDRPVITGVAHNSHNPSAVTIANSTRNVIQTGGRNRIEMEDQEGSQYVWQNTPPLDTFFYMGATFQAHNLILSTKGLGKIFTGDNFDITVQGAMTTEVTLAVNETYHNTQTTNVTLAVTENYHNTQTTNVTLAVTENYNNTKTTNVTLAVIENCLDTVTQLYMGDHTMTLLANRNEVIIGAYNQAILNGHTQFIGGPGHNVNVAALYDLKATDVKWTIGNAVNWAITNDVTIDCNAWEVNQRGKVIWKSAGEFLHIKFEKSSEITGGLKSSIFVGGAIDVFVGAKVSVDASVSFALTIGPHFEKKVLELKHKDVKMEAMEAKLTTIEAELAHREAYLLIAAIVVIL